jgi:hypothetical protein
MVVRSEETLWDPNTELCGHLKSHPSSCPRRRWSRGIAQDHAVGGWTNGTGIQSEEESKGGLLAEG